MKPLRHDPYRIFRKSKTPAGLYARQKWLKQNDGRYREAFEETVGQLWASQGACGAWDGSLHLTIQRLFGLHLTVRHATPAILKALAWLMNRSAAPDHDPDPQFLDSALFENLPFAPSRPALYLTSAALFLNTIFVQGDNPSVLKRYATLLRELDPDALLQEDPAGLNNVMRALVVHPRFADHSAVERIVGGLAKHQTQKGTWGNTIPFFQMVNALAHLKLPASDLPLERAFTYLRLTQNTDGTWGTNQTEWNTFLVVHALRNKGLL